MPSIYIGQDNGVKVRTDSHDKNKQFLRNSEVTVVMLPFSFVYSRNYRFKGESKYDSDEFIRKVFLNISQVIP